MKDRTTDKELQERLGSLERRASEAETREEAIAREQCGTADSIRGEIEMLRARLQDFQ